MIPCFSFAVLFCCQFRWLFVSLEIWGCAHSFHISLSLPTSFVSLFTETNTAASNKVGLPMYRTWLFISQWNWASRYQDVFRSQQMCEMWLNQSKSAVGGKKWYFCDCINIDRTEWRMCLDLLHIFNEIRGFQREDKQSSWGCHQYRSKGGKWDSTECGVYATTTTTSTFHSLGWI